MHLRRVQSALSSGVALSLMAAAVFGLYAPAARGVYADGGNAILVAVVTTWARALTLAVYCIAARQPIFKNREHIKQALVGGLFQAASILATFAALAYLAAPVVVIIIFSHTLMLLFFMAWRGETKLDFLTFATTVAALIGLVLVLDVRHAQNTHHWLGIVLAVFAALATASRLYVYGHQTKLRHPIAVGAENFLFAAPIASVALLFVSPHLPQNYTGWTWLGVSSGMLAVGTVCMFYGISKIGSFRYSLFGKSQPLFTAIFSACLFGEILQLHQYVGIGIVLASLALYQIAEQGGRKDA